MITLNYEELDRGCLEVLEGSKFYSDFITDAHIVLYETGCRPIELWNAERWRFTEDRILVLKPAKGNNERKIRSRRLPRSFVDYVNREPSKFNLATYYKCANLFHHLWPYPQCFIKSKQVDQYVFRHRYVKGLANSGMSNDEIQQAMGWKNENLVAQYVKSKIYYNR